MQITTARESIAKTTSTARESSFREKEGLTQEQVINDFLDRILEFKKIVSDKTAAVDEHVLALEKITWFEFKLFDEDLKQKLNDLIASTRDWADALEKWYDRCNSFCEKDEIASSEITEFRASLDDLEETNNDLERIFFNHVKNEIFIQNTRELSNL